MGTIIFNTHSGESITVAVSEGTSVMQAATSQGVPGIEAECGGSLSCATCHVYLSDPWFSRFSPPSETELQMLEFAEAPRDNSRLSCQLRFTEELSGLTVQLPESQ